MLRIWCLLVPIFLYIPLIFSTRLVENPCEAIDTTPRNLSNAAVIFAKLDGEERDFDETENQYPGVMERFYECYGGSGGLKVVHLKFRRYWKKSEGYKCELKLPRPNLLLKSKRVKIILSVRLADDCSRSYVETKLQETFSLDPTRTTSLVAGIFDSFTYRLMSNWSSPNGTLFYEASQNTKLYELLETEVDRLASSKWNETSLPGNLGKKYVYFDSLPKLRRQLWPSIAAVILVIVFFILGLLMCCCSLFVYALVDEDFRRRNDERNWINDQLRRREILDMPPMPIQEPINESLITNNNAETDRSSLASISSLDVHTDRTQLSETEPLLSVVLKRKPKDLNPTEPRR